MSKYLITGGSGFIGYHFHDVIPNAEIVNFDILPPNRDIDSRYVEGDIQNTDHLAENMKGSEVVIHLAATHFDFQKNYHKTNVEGTQSLVEAAELAGVKKIVFYSSVAVYGAISEPTDENVAPKPNMPYGESKFRAEEVLQKWASKGEDRLLIIMRPTVVYGEFNFGNVFNLIKQIDSGVYFHVGKGQNVKSITYVKNLVSNTLTLLDRLEQGVHVFNNVDEPQLNTKELANTIADILGKRVKIALPIWLVKILVGVFGVLSKIIGKTSPITKERLIKFTSSTHFVPAAQNKLGLKLKFESQAGLKNTIDWYHESDWEGLYKEWRERVENYS